MRKMTNLRIILIVGLVVVIGMTFNFLLFTSFSNSLLGVVGVMFNTLKFSIAVAIISLWIKCHFILAFISLLFWLILTCISIFATVTFLALNFIYENISIFMELATFFEVFPYALIGFAIKENLYEK